MKGVVQPQSSQSETYTYIAIPVEALQCSDQGVQAVTFAQNIIFKTVDNTSITQQILQGAEALDASSIAGTNKMNLKVLHNFHSPLMKPPEKQNVLSETCNRPTVIEQTQKSPQFGSTLIRKSVILKSDKQKAVAVGGDKSEIRYLKIKSIRNNNKIVPRKRRELEVGEFKCTLCGQTLNRLRSYRKHMEIHRNAKKFKCEQCSACYNIEDNLKLHMAIHSKSTPTCPICDRKFQRFASLRAHILIHQMEETFTCVECFAEYDKEDDFNKHMDSHKKEEENAETENLPLVCSICSHAFTDINEYKQHISLHIKIKKLMNGRKPKRKQLNNRENLHKCQVCKKSFAKYCLLERHMRIHSGEKPFVCHLCKRAFTQKGTLQIHLARHDGLKPFHCTLCPAKFCQKGNLRVHVQKTHMMPGPNEKVYKCTMCTCIFKRVSSLNAHITRAHAGDKRLDEFTDILEQLKDLEKQLAPRTVDQKKADSVVETLLKKNDAVLSESRGMSVRLVKLVDSSIEGTLRRYLVRARRIGEHQWYLCSYCSKEFKKPSDLIRHFRVHTREKPFKCKQCDQAFSLKSTLVTHISTHMAHRQYQCISCSKMFASIRSLQTHLRRHDKGIAKRPPPYTCITCDKVFSSVTKAKLHMEVHKAGVDQSNETEIEVVMRQPMVETPHGLLPVAPSKSKRFVEPESDKPRPHKCNHCQAGFTKAVHLKRHLLTHSTERERKYKCNICTKSFYASYALKEHMKFHSGERNFPCKFCGKKYVTNAILKRHQIIHSNHRPYVCPYCKKRFKTVMMCRKHINIHKRDLDWEICALQETGEMDNLKITNGTATVTDLNDPDADNPFSDSFQDDDDDDDSVDDPPSVSADKGTDLSRPIILGNSVLSVTKLANLRLLDQESNVSKISFTDLESGFIISTPNADTAEVQNNNNEAHDPPYEQGFPRGPPPPYVDKPTNLSLLSDNTADLANVEDAITTLTHDNLIEGNDVGTPMVYINSDDLQSLTTANLYNACLAQLKNNDPLLLSGINEIQDPNLLFATDPTLNQLADIQLDSQNIETLIPTFTLSTNLTVNNSTNSSYPNIILSNIEDNDINQLPIFPSINEFNKKFQASVNSFSNVVITETNDNQKLQGVSADMDLHDDSIADMNQEGAILSNLFYNADQLDISLNTDHSKASSEAVPEPSTANLEVLNPISHSSTTTLNPALNSSPAPLEILNPVSTSSTNMNSSTGSLAAGLKTSMISNSSKPSLVTSSSIAESFKATSESSNATISSTKASLENANCHRPSASADSVFADMSFLCSNCNHIFNSIEDFKNHPCNMISKPSKKRKPADRSRKRKNQNILEILNPSSKETNSTTKSNRADTDSVEGSDTGHKCAECGEVLQTKQRLLRHMERHALKPSHACTYCGKVFKKRSDLERHIRTHTGEKPFTCDICAKSFSLKSTLDSHYRTHNPGGNKDFSCVVCSSYFSSKASLRVHLMMHTGAKPYQCPMCPEKFRTSGHRKTHLANHLKNTETKKQGQSKAGKVNSLLASVVMDSQNSVQNTEENSSLLGGVQQSDTPLEVTEQDLEADLLYPSQSVLVDSSFLQQFPLNHMLSSENAEELPSFIQLDINSEGQITNIKPVTSSAIDSVNYLDNTLGQSVMVDKSSTKLDTVITTVRNFECDVCHKKYSTKAVLTKHKKIHALQNRTCKECNAGFSCEGDLKNHEKLHSGDYRPFSCQMCANTFSQQKNLKTHMKRIHGVTS